MKKEKAQQVWKHLKKHGPLTIELDTPSPSPQKKRVKTSDAIASASSSTHDIASLLGAEGANLHAEEETPTIMNPELPSLPNDPDDDSAFPRTGEAPEDEMDAEEEELLGGGKPGDCQEHVAYKDVRGVCTCTSMVWVSLSFLSDGPFSGCSQRHVVPAGCLPRGVSL